MYIVWFVVTRTVTPYPSFLYFSTELIVSRAKPYGSVEEVETFPVL